MTRTKTTMALVVLLLASGMAVAEADREPEQPRSYAPAAQDLTGLAMDAQGKYVAAVTTVSPTGLTDTLTNQAGDPHLYLYDTKAPRDKPWYEARHGEKHRDTTLTDRQVVAVSASVDHPGKAYIAVGGPSRTVALWDSISSAPTWETKVLGSDERVVEVAITSDGSRVFAAANKADASAKGVLYAYETRDGDGGKTAYLRWAYNVTEAFNGGASITDLALSRDGNILAIGTTQGLLVIPTTVEKEEDLGEVGKSGTKLEPCCTSTGAITAVDLSADGRFVVAGTTKGFGYLVDRSTDQTWARTLESTTHRVNDVAITLDGNLFAFGTDSGKVVFMERLDTVDLAQQLHQPFDAGKPVRFLEYDAEGTTLIVATDAMVYGFHEARASALWAMGLANHGLQGPVTGLAVSDDGERFVVSGKRTVLPFVQSVKASATVDRMGASVHPGDKVRFVFTVTNEGSKGDEYELDITQPVGWTVGGENDATKAIFPGESRTFNMTLSTPTGQSPGYHDATVRVVSLAKLDKDPSSRGRIAEFKLNVSVAAVPDIRFETASDDLELEQGEATPYAFTIRNLGNAEAQVNLTAIPDPSRVGSVWTLNFEEPQVIVGPGDAKTAHLVVTAPRDASDGDYNDITIRGRVGTSAFAETQLRARVSPTFGVSLEAAESAFQIPYGETKAIKLRVQNTGNTRDLVNLSYVITPATAIGGWTVNLDRDELDMNGRESREVTLAVKPKSRDAADLQIRVVARSEGGGVEEDLSFTVGLPTVQTQDEGTFLPAPGVALVALAGVCAALVAARPRRPLR